MKEKQAGKYKPRDRIRARDDIQVPPELAGGRQQEITRKTGDIALYRYYFDSIGPSRLLLLVGSLTLHAVFMGVIPNGLRRIGEDGGEHIWFDTGIYSGLILGAFIPIATAVAVVLFVIAPHSGNTLHARLLRTVMYAPSRIWLRRIRTRYLTGSAPT